LAGPALQLDNHLNPSEYVVVDGAQVLPLYVLSAVRKRSLGVVIAGCLLIFAAAGLRDKPLDVTAEFSSLSLTVKAESLGLSTAKAEPLIRAALTAGLLNGVLWLQTIGSESMAGRSRINLRFGRGTDLIGPPLRDAVFDGGPDTSTRMWRLGIR
jgi:hypothetical protein